MGKWVPVMPETPLEPNKPAPAAKDDGAAAATAEDEVSLDILHNLHVFVCRISCCALLLLWMIARLCHIMQEKLHIA